MLRDIIDYYHFTPHSTTLTMACGSQGQRKAKPSGFIFSHTFQLIRINFVLAFEQFNTLWSEISRIKGNNCCFTDCVKNFNVGMHPDVYIWFKFAMTIGITNSYVRLTLD